VYCDACKCQWPWHCTWFLQVSIKSLYFKEKSSAQLHADVVMMKFICHTGRTQLTVTNIQTDRQTDRYKKVISNKSGRHFRVYFVENWTDLDKTWQRDGEWGRSDPINFWRDHSRNTRERGKIPTFFCDEYTTQSFGHFHFTDFRETWHEYRESMSAIRMNPFISKF